ncbi:YtxH domain-containing protein [Flavobacterium sp. NKUCC04_CG]|uniref:YtxH domain-containing protein n=1 Tax=Flavobacterium sp. NKUCC04_CG TaxID=2842121 RepID=UPI001C5AD974|nr:YtxH domain-containing protein [Flavobacterium sp. NKUCC04_CG]MBW3518858.1 YtxH domain-containing protein [Flavobacterium sp. NKUCC04_CG]
MSNQLGNTFIAVLAGAAVGAGLGMLFAPEEGTKMRKKLKKGFSQSKDGLSDKIDELKKQVKGVVERKKHDFEEGFEELISTTGKKSEDVISALEKKLAELKKEASKAANAK